MNQKKVDVLAAWLGVVKTGAEAVKEITLAITAIAAIVIANKAVTAYATVKGVTDTSATPSVTARSIPDR